MVDRPIGERIQALATRFEAAFPERLTTPRKVGREAEYPVVDAGGAAVDLSALWPQMMAGGDWQPKFDAVYSDLIVGLEGEDYSFAWEVGRSTIEINSRPCAHLLELQEIHQRALQELVAHAERFQWSVLGYGIQPLTPPSLALMAPKQRYGALLEIMGEDWLWYTVTASEQLHVDVARPEMAKLLNFGLLMAPIVIAFCGNSPVYAGAISRFCSAREGVVTHQSRYKYRHGMPERPYVDTADFITRIAQLPYLLRRQDRHLLPDGRPFLEALQDEVNANEEAAFEALLLHDHYLWHSARLRVAHATLELRPACQQPPGEQMAAAALYLGLVEASDAIEHFLGDSLGTRLWDQMRSYQGAACQGGLASEPPVPDLLPRVLDLAEKALAARGFGEEMLLAPLWQRLEKRQSPAQDMRRAFVRSGLAGLLDQAKIGLEL